MKSDKLPTSYELGQVVKKYREEIGMSARELSLKIGDVSEYYITQLEKRPSKTTYNVNYEAIIKAFRILGLSDEEINNHIPLDVYKAEREKFYNEKIEEILTQAKLLPQEYIGKFYRELRKLNLRSRD
jgi:transcriptional regulator with XRE-family HTH domain